MTNSPPLNNMLFVIVLIVNFTYKSKNILKIRLVFILARDFCLIFNLNPFILVAFAEIIEGEQMIEENYDDYDDWKDDEENDEDG
ncbi:MAG: hypothetical protein P8X87_05965 [Candidatus Bathyarchaeota archaeon]